MPAVGLAPRLHEQMFDTCVLGVDPGVARMGLACVARADRRPVLLWSETVRTPAGMDEAELEILRAGPGARVTWLHLTPDPSSAPEAEHAPEGDNPLLTVLGAARLPEGMGTEEFMQKTRGAPDPARQDGPGARVMSLEDHLKRKP